MELCSKILFLFLLGVMGNTADCEIGSSCFSDSEGTMTPFCSIWILSKMASVLDISSSYWILLTLYCLLVISFYSYFSYFLGSTYLLILPRCTFIVSSSRLEPGPLFCFFLVFDSYLSSFIVVSIIYLSLLLALSLPPFFPTR